MSKNLSDVRPTESTYGYIQQAYDFFNQRLWDGNLPQCLITMQRHKGAYGYYSPGKFVEVDPSDISSRAEADEIAEVGVGAQAEGFRDVAGRAGAEVAGAGAEEKGVEFVGGKAGFLQGLG